MYFLIVNCSSFGYACLVRHYGSYVTVVTSITTAQLHCKVLLTVAPAWFLGVNYTIMIITAKYILPPDTDHD